MSLTKQRTRFGPVLKNRDFAFLWIGQTISNAGDFIGDLALLYFAFELTRSPITMAVLGTAQVLPKILLGGVMGIAIDRWNRKHLMVLADIIRAVVTLSVPLVVHLDLLMSP